MAARLAELVGDRAAAVQHCDAAEAYLAGDDPASGMHALIVEMLTRVRAAMTALSRRPD